MQLTWVGTWQKSKTRFKAAWLITAGLMALYFGTSRLYEGRRIAAEKGTGLAAAQWDPNRYGSSPPMNRFWMRVSQK